MLRPTGPQPVNGIPAIETSRLAKQTTSYQVGTLYRCLLLLICDYYTPVKVKLVQLHAGGGSLYEEIAYVIEKLLPFFFSLVAAPPYVYNYYLTDF